MERRFQLLPDSVDALISGEENKNTAAKTRRDLSVVEMFLKRKGERNSIENIPPEKLNDYLAEFVLAVKRKDGEDYEPSTIRGFIASVERHLREKNYVKSVVSDKEFRKTINAMKARFKMLKRDGKGNKPKASVALSDNEVDILYSKNILGSSSAHSLINTLWLNNCIYFGLRSGLEHRNLRWGDVQLFEDSEGCEFLEVNERQTKTRQGEDVRNVRSVKPRMYANPGSDRCPVEIFKLYMHKREGNSCDSFYLAVNETKRSDSSRPWFKCSPMGQNKLATIMRRMAEEGNINNPRLTNHSARKRLVQTLVDNDVAPTEIVQISGHRNLQSINNYSHLSEKKMQHISSILSGNQNTDVRLSSKMSDISLSNSSNKSITYPAPVMENAIIHGGEFHFHIGCSEYGYEKQDVKRRRRVIISDSSSQESTD